MRLVALSLLLGSGCGHPAPPRPAPIELPVAGAASFAGSWVADDDLDWGYTLTVNADGNSRLVIDRGKMGVCEEVGTLSPGQTARTFQLTYGKNTCNPHLAAARLEVRVASFTGQALTLALQDEGREVRRTYLRDPKVGPTGP